MLFRSWLDKNLPPLEITEEMRRNHHQLDLDELKRMLAERLAEQTEEHHGGNRWVVRVARPPLDIQATIRAASE